MPEYIHRNQLQMLFASYAVTRHYPFLASIKDKQRQIDSLLNTEQSPFRDRFSQAYDEQYGAESCYHRPFLTYAEAANFLQNNMYFVYEQDRTKRTAGTQGDLEQLVAEFVQKTIPSMKLQQKESIAKQIKTPLDLTPFSDLYTRLNRAA
jgi:hypothetical protein